MKKILVTVPERYEATITTLENIKDLSRISLEESLSALQAQDQRILMREDITIEGALVAKHQEATKSEWKNKTKESSTSAELATGKVKDGQKKSYPLYQNCNKKGYPSFKCWRRLDGKCSNCQQMGA